MSTRKTTAEKIEAAIIEKQQAEARIKKLLQQQKAEERKARNHRLCKRGGLVEKFLPDLARLTDEQFDIFVEKTLLTPHTAKVLTELAPPLTAAEPEGKTDTVQDEGVTTAKPTDGAAQSNAAPAPKPTITEQGGGTGNNGKPAQTSAAPNGADGSRTGATARVAG